MFDFYEKRKLRGILFSRLTAGLLLSLALLLFISAYERFVAERETREKRTESALRLDELQQRAALLESRVERMESDRGIEEEIRSQFDVAKEGEQVIVIVEDKEIETTSTKTKIYPLPEEPSLLDRWKFW